MAAPWPGDELGVEIPRRGKRLTYGQSVAQSNAPEIPETYGSPMRSISEYVGDPRRAWAEILSAGSEGRSAAEDYVKRLIAEKLAGSISTSHAR